MDRDISNIIGGVTLFLGSAGLYLYTEAAGYQMGSGMAYDAGLMPELWLAIAAISALAMAAKGVVGRVSRPGSAPALARIGLKRLVLAFGLSATFLIAFAWLGFWIPILLFIPVFSLCFGYRNITVIVLSTLIFAAGTWFVFAWLLEVQMTAFPEFLNLGG